MINITELCRRFNLTSEHRKLPGHFMLLNELAAVRQQRLSKVGAKGYTEIPDEFLTRFLEWLSPEFKEQLDAGTPPEEIRKNI